MSLLCHRGIKLSHLAIRELFSSADVRDSRNATGLRGELFQVALVGFCPALEHIGETALGRSWRFLGFRFRIGAPGIWSGVHFFLSFLSAKSIVSTSTQTLFPRTSLEVIRMSILFEIPSSVRLDVIRVHFPILSLRSRDN